MKTGDEKIDFTMSTMFIERIQQDYQIFMNDILKSANGEYYQVSMFKDHMENLIQISLSAKLLYEKIGQKSFKYPSSWIQAFKERFFSHWLLEKFPVKYTEIDITCKALFPGFQPKLPGNDWTGISQFINKETEWKQ